MEAALERREVPSFTMEERSSEPRNTDGLDYLLELPEKNAAIMTSWFEPRETHVRILFCKTAK